MHYGRDKIITDVTLKLALIEQLAQLTISELLTPLLTFDLFPELDLLKFHGYCGGKFHQHFWPFLIRVTHIAISHTQ